jgi:hypothetical protein
MQPIAIKNLVIAAAFWLLPASTASFACEGEDLERTNQMAEHMQFVQQTCNESGSVQDSMNCLREEWGYTAQKMANLPQECLDILKEFEQLPE